MISDKDFLNIRVGQAVGTVARPSAFPTRELCSKLGWITAKVEDRWGRHFTIEFMDGSTDTMHGIMHPGSDKGIGCYLLED